MFNSTTNPTGWPTPNYGGWYPPPVPTGPVWIDPEFIPPPCQFSPCWCWCHHCGCDHGRSTTTSTLTIISGERQTLPDPTEFPMAVWPGEDDLPAPESDPSKALPEPGEYADPDRPQDDGATA